MCVTVQTSPSLALIKYWGKSCDHENLPATSSLAIGLEELKTKTTVSFRSDHDQVVIDGKEVSMERFVPFFERLRAHYQTKQHFLIESCSNFPHSAGLASSSSGLAAIAYGCGSLFEEMPNWEALSSIARLGSASAARALYGGFTVLPAKTAGATPLFPAEHWPELRVLIAVISTEQKKLSSREAMRLSRETSPYYAKWVEESEKLFSNAKNAVANRDLTKLGSLMQQSYLMMFSTMFTAIPPVLYWQPESLAVIHACEKLRGRGIAVWETMDAGPQVKLLLEKEALETVKTNLQELFPNTTLIESTIGGAPRHISP